MAELLRNGKMNQGVIIVKLSLNSCWKIAKCPKTLPSEWDRKGISEARAKSQWAAREALRLVLEDWGHSTAPNIHQVTVDHFQLEPWGHRVSLSHSRDYGVAVLAKASHFQSVGIDFELSSRNMNPQGQSKFCNELDEKFELLEGWCLKEAAFKALDPIKSEYDWTKAQLLLKDIWVKEKNFGLVQNPNQIIGQLSFEKIQYDQETFHLAIATIPV